MTASAPATGSGARHDVNVDKAAKPFTHANVPVQRQAVNIHVMAQEGQPLEIRWTLAQQPDITVTVGSDEPLARANNRGVTLDYLAQQLGRLGNTAYQLGALTADIAGEPFIPSSLLNRLRQSAVNDLISQQVQLPETVIHDPINTLDTALSAVDRQVDVMVGFSAAASSARPHAGAA